jgi:hypothetical protein
MHLFLFINLFLFIKTTRPFACILHCAVQHLPVCNFRDWKTLVSTLKWQVIRQLCPFIRLANQYEVAHRHNNEVARGLKIWKVCPMSDSHTRRIFTLKSKRFLKYFRLCRF